jgi:hypothetical protein
MSLFPTIRRDSGDQDGDGTPTPGVATAPPINS